MSKKILVLLGNPDPETFSGEMANHYQAAAEEAGHEVARLNIGEMKFDPVLHNGYKEIQDLEPDLVDFQEKVRWADHIVIVYPNWWCSMPAVLKGLFDRSWLPGFAFNFNHETGKCEQHLKGKTSRVIIIAGTHSPFMTWWKFGDFTNEIQYGILGFAGIRSEALTFGPSTKVTDEKRKKWLDQVAKLGRKGC